MHTYLCLSSSCRKAKTQGLLIFTPLTLLTENKTTGYSSHQSQALASNLLHTYPFPPFPPPPPTPLATNVIRMKILKIPPGVMGREPQSRVPQSHACSATQRGAWPLPAGGLKEMTSSGTCDRTMFFLHLYRELSSCCHSLVRFCTTRFIILASTKESAFKIQILKNNLE